MKEKFRKGKKKDSPTYSVADNVLFLWKGIWENYPLLLVMMGIQCVFSVISPVLGIYLPRMAVELASERAELSEIMVRLGGMGALLALSMALSSMADMGKYMMLNSTRRKYRKQLFMDSLYCGYEQIESVEGQRKYARARETLDWGDFSGNVVMCNGVIKLAVNLAGFVIYSGIISTLDFRVILLLVGLSLLNLLTWTANDVQYGKDIRLYGMGQWFPRIQEQVLSSYMELSSKIKNRYFGAGAVNGATLFFRDGIAYAFLIGSVVSGKITVGDFVLYFGAVTGFSTFVGNIVDSANLLHKSNLQMNDMRAFLDAAEETEEGEAAEASYGSHVAGEKKGMESVQACDLFLWENFP